MRETIVPRSRHTDREHIKISRDDKGRDVETSIGIDPRQDDTVKIEDFLTLGKEERSAMPVSIIDIRKENLDVKLYNIYNGIILQNDISTPNYFRSTTKDFLQRS